MSELETFRLETHAWLDANCPQSQRQPVKTAELINPGSKQVFPSEDAKLWFERMRDKGWTCPDFPKQYGGAGLDVAQEKVLRDEMKRLTDDPTMIDAILADGAARAREIAEPIMSDVRKLVGFLGN